MDRFIILTAAGQDQPGIVAKISRVLYKTGWNIEDTSMTRLRGEFTMMLIVKVPAKLPLDKFNRSLGKVQAELGLSFLVKPLLPREARRTSKFSGRCYILSVYGADRPGIVYRVTDLMASHGINITDMNTRVIGSKLKPIYVMIIEVEIPSKLRIHTLKAHLQKLKREVSVDITLHPVESAQL